MFILYLLILVAGLVGLSITFSIYKEKHQKKPLVCPFGADCHTVVTGGFSKFLGVGLEIYGAAYYAFIVTIYLLFVAAPSLASPMTVFIVTGITAAGFLFSLYLTFVQAFLIKSWCSWCLMSAGVSTAIFIFSMISVSVDTISFLPILEQYKDLILFGHLLGFVIGVGGATMSDMLFFRFLKDFRISEKEEAVLKAASQFIWVGLFIVVISGIGLFIPQSEALMENPKFLVKALVVFIIIVNGAALNLFVSPKLVEIAWKDAGVPVRETLSLRRTAFMLGAISFISWYSAFLLGFVKTTSYGFLELLGIYVGATVIAIIISQMTEMRLCGSTKRK
jgi:uncharacterized membrane protein